MFHYFCEIFSDLAVPGLSIAMWVYLGASGADPWSWFLYYGLSANPSPPGGSPPQHVKADKVESTLGWQSGLSELRSHAGVPTGHTPEFR